MYSHHNKFYVSNCELGDRSGHYIKKMSCTSTLNIDYTFLYKKTPFRMLELTCLFLYFKTYIVFIFKYNIFKSY